MPVNFLTDEQNQNYGRYPDKLTEEQLHRYFHLDDKDKELITNCRRNYNKLGYALQLSTVRFLGMFLPNPIDAPIEVKRFLAKQLNISRVSDLPLYLQRKATKLSHIKNIKEFFEYSDFEKCRFQLTRYLYSQSWFGNERPSILFERSTMWLINRKILLPGVTTLVVLISRIRDRVAKRLWQQLAALVNPEQKEQLENLLIIENGKRRSKLDELKNGPTNISSIGLTKALLRYQFIRNLGTRKINFSNIPKAKINHLARYVTATSATSIARMPEEKRIAALLSFAYIYETKSLDDAFDLLDVLITEITAKATRLRQKKRMRSMGDLDNAALNLSNFVELFIKHEASVNLTNIIYQSIPKDFIIKSIATIKEIARPNNNLYYEELVEQYRTVRRFLPMLLNTAEFKATMAGTPMLETLEFLASVENKRNSSFNNAPLNIVNSGWQNIVINPESDQIERHGYNLCAMANLQTNLRSRDIFVENSDRWCDPRAKLLKGSDWDKYKNPVYNSLNLSTDFNEAFDKLSVKLNNTYQEVINRLANNNAVLIVKDQNNKSRIKLSRLEKIEEPDSLKKLKDQIALLIPNVDLPELLLEVNRLTKFTEEFTHISDTQSRVSGIETSLCAVLMADACNIGMESVIKKNVPQLTRSRLSWVQQNYIRAETLAKANACIVDYHTKLPLALKFGTGDVASADGLRFTSAIRTVNSGTNRKYYGSKRGLTYYNFTSDQNAGFHGIVIPGTLRDSLYLLDGIQDQQTSLDPKEIITDTAGASEVVFALFWLLGYQFSPRLSDIGSTRFWRINNNADYGKLNDIAKHKINEALIKKYWEDILRIAVSLKLGHVSASELIRSLFRKNRPSGLARALMNLGRIIKTLYLLNYIDNEDYRRHILIQLNKGESRHSLARTIYYGRRGEIYQKYREGQEDQLTALGLVTNAIIVWNTIYIQSALDYLRSQGEIINEEDESKLSPLTQGHINFLGHFSFLLSEIVESGFLRPLSLVEDV
jgi:TnpA family transposase